MKAKINSVLEKKLEELESLLKVVTFEDDDPNLRKMQLGIIFVRTLFTAEISSRPMDMEGKEDVEELFKFRCMAKRLSEMETFITDQLSGRDNGSLIVPEMESLESNAGAINGETGADSSLVESCPKEFIPSIEEEEEEEEVEEEEEEVEAEQWPLFQDASPTEMREVKFTAVGTEKGEVVDREEKENGRVCFRALVCFGLIGVVGCMMSLVGFVGDSMKDDYSFLTPT